MLSFLNFPGDFFLTTFDFRLFDDGSYTGTLARRLLLDFFAVAECCVWNISKTRTIYNQKHSSSMEDNILLV